MEPPFVNRTRSTTSVIESVMGSLIGQVGADQWQ
jgi:hypothetical protein